MKETYTREEVIEMLIEMQIKAAKTQGFIIGNLPTLFVVKTLLGEKIEELGGKGVEIKFV